jgi:hypothetical protein
MIRQIGKDSFRYYYRSLFVHIVIINAITGVNSEEQVAPNAFLELFGTRSRTRSLLGLLVGGQRSRIQIQPRYLLLHASSASALRDQTRDRHGRQEPARNSESSPVAQGSKQT